MEHKTLAFEIKAIDYTGRTLEGFAAAFGNLDQVGDIIHPGAFRKTLSERGGRIKFLWQHDPTEPIGKLQEAREDQGGLFVKAIISDTQRGRDALALLKDGAIGEMSIGYDTVKGGMDYSKDEKGNPVRNLREVKLWEFSLVTFPANEMAQVTAVKTQDVAPAEDDADAVPPQVKIGRTISAANYAKLQAAREVISDLCKLYKGAGELTEDGESATMKLMPPATLQAGDQLNSATSGPVSPPNVKLAEIEVYLSELTMLEVNHDRTDARLHGDGETGI